MPSDCRMCLLDEELEVYARRYMIEYVRAITSNDDLRVLGVLIQIDADMDNIDMDSKDLQNVLRAYRDKLREEIVD